MNKIERAIETLKMENELMQFDPNTGEDYPIELQNQDNQDLYNANLVAISALEEKLNGGWIPVSERLPSYDCMCLVTDGENVFIATYDACLGWGSYKFNKKSITFRRTKYVTTAWQPLPPAYKEVENE